MNPVRLPAHSLPCGRTRAQAQAGAMQPSAAWAVCVAQRHGGAPRSRSPALSETRIPRRGPARCGCGCGCCC
eukprot:scaffold4_cov396-Prasinococcus_capsulatus_cf.AAC.1